MRSLLAVPFFVLAAPTAIAEDAPGIPVTVVVVDEAGEPIRTAVVRHPRERERHPVNTSTGAWTASILYLDDGSELIFEKGMVVELEISAPMYVNQRVTYQVRRRKNKVTVPLQRMNVERDASDDDPVIQFGRDKPIDGRQGETPAQ